MHCMWDVRGTSEKAVKQSLGKMISSWTSRYNKIDIAKRGCDKPYFELCVALRASGHAGNAQLGCLMMVSTPLN